uniref:Uncharacterized protein n=1 Tax=Setaria viridis TaxID=4556 RepID=A0A4U6TMJ8_SETVI|nr:hypothetical protein SEVIR_7G068245v2 [Setaria viridis]
MHAHISCVMSSLLFEIFFGCKTHTKSSFTTPLETWYKCSILLVLYSLHGIGPESDTKRWSRPY